MAFDQHRNLAISTVAVPPSPVNSGTSLDVFSGHGARFPAPPFNCTIWPAGSMADPANAEIVRCTAIVDDTLTIVREQEGTGARAILVGDLVAATVTARTLTDIEDAATAPVAYTHTQGAPAMTWTIAHGLGFHPGGVHVQNSAGDDVEGDVEHIDENGLTITFHVGAFSGAAYLS